MTMFMMLIASGWAGSLVAPQLSEPTANECNQATPIRVGGGLPPAILGPDGMPMDQTRGQDQTRQGLTPDTINPSQIGANMAG